MKPKQYKLIVHQANFSDEDLIISNKDFSSVAIDDIVEIYHPEDEVSRLLLQVTSIREDFQQKDTISVKQSVANAFQLRTFANVYVNIVKFKDVVLDSIELTFKDQYLGRGDMWRLKKNMEKTCVYLNKKIEFCGIRCEVYEMWAQGERVACGTISEDTKIVFRSSTSQVYLFIQLSSEMWDMDISGDLYFEKAVNGFLTDLFYKWKKNGSNHEVTIVLFSRTFYEAQNIEEFPSHMRGCLQQDYKGRYYEDFYRVAVQNERYDDWAVILYELKRLFNGYPRSVLDYHKQAGSHIPKGVNSTAAQGNFLEVLNMSLNVFDKHYLDRSFERTGQLSVVITPGVGVFEVDRDLTNITKQRIIDNGVGSDLVCLGEQPLHAVPLFKFHNKNVLNAVDDYSMPHWINLSFYSSSKPTTYSSFVPRIKLPQMKIKTHKDNNKNNGLITRTTKQTTDDDTSFPFVNYDAYDAQVFKLPTAHISGPHHTRSLQRTPNRKRSDQYQHFQPKQVPPYRKFSEADITLFQTELFSHSLTRSPAISIPVQLPDSHSPASVSSTGVVASESEKTATPKDNSGRVRHSTNPMEWEEELSPPSRTIVGSAGSPYSPKAYRAYLLRPGRALINPFDPSHVTIKLTSNRRRWTHVFPLGPTGIFMQQHHYQAVPQGTSNRELASSLGQEATTVVTEVKRKRSLISHRISESEMDRDRHGIDIPGRGRNVASRASMYANEVQNDRSLTLLWGATGEQEWTPALTTGVDWKSLTIPACLPLTTDYFPDRRSLQNDYLQNDYTLLPEDVASEIAQRMGSNARPLTTIDVFEELISQRLQQGFQQIVLPKLMGAGNIGQGTASPQITPFVARSSGQNNTESTQEYFLSIGRIFHKVTLVGSTITVTCFRPRHPYPMLNIHYQYRFQAPDMDNYEVSWVNFMSEKLESFNWNYLDHYVCWRGQGQFNLIESLKYWRFRVFLLPYHTHANRKQFDESENYYGQTPMTVEREMQMIDNFLRIIEMVNKIKKPFNTRKARKSGTITKPLLTRASQPLMQTTPLVQGSAPNSSQFRTSLGASAFRDRVGSSRLPDRPRIHSGPAKPIERVRSESGNGGRVSPAGEIIDSREASYSTQSLDADLVNESCGDDISTGSSSVPQTPELRKFSITSPRNEIVEAMKQQPDGLVFLSKQQGTPSYVFISADAVAWIIDHVDGAGYQEAIEMLEDMLSNGVICHASGCDDYPLIYGFHLYYFVPNEKEFGGESWQPCEDLSTFQNDWLEVSVKSSLIPSTMNTNQPNWKRLGRENVRGSSCTPKTSDCSLSRPKRTSRSKSIYKGCHMSLEPNEKLARTEWGHLRYHNAFVPGTAYEICINWMVATSSMISESLQNWNRKANSFNFQLAPVPNDPFALPFSYKSDPLRAPIFIPLHIDFIVKNFSVVDQMQDLIKFQEKIADHFGFISCVTEDNDSDSQNYYIHISGYMFLMIPTRSKELQGICIPTQNRSSAHMSHLNVGSISSPHEEYITRHVMGKSGKCVYEEMDGSRVGFLLSWNHMFTKRWKSQSIATADDIITNKTFKDIRALCSDKDMLQSLWEDW